MTWRDRRAFKRLLKDLPEQGEQMAGVALDFFDLDYLLERPKFFSLIMEKASNLNIAKKLEKYDKKNDVNNTLMILLESLITPKVASIVKYLNDYNPELALAIRDELPVVHEYIEKRGPDVCPKCGKSDGIETEQINSYDEIRGEQEAGYDTQGNKVYYGGHKVYVDVYRKSCKNCKIELGGWEEEFSL